MCQCRVNSHNKYSTLVSDLDNGEAVPGLGQEVYEKSVYFLNFAVNLKLL